MSKKMNKDNKYSFTKGEQGSKGKVDKNSTNQMVILTRSPYWIAWEGKRNNADKRKLSYPC